MLLDIFPSLDEDCVLLLDVFPSLDEDSAVLLDVFPSFDEDSAASSLEKLFSTLHEDISSNVGSEGLLADLSFPHEYKNNKEKIIKSFFIILSIFSCIADIKNNFSYYCCREIKRCRNRKIPMRFNSCALKW